MDRFFPLMDLQCVAKCQKCHRGSARRSRRCEIGDRRCA